VIRDGAVLGAVWAELFAGKSSLLWGPEMHEGGSAVILPQLLEVAIRYLQQQQIHLVQALPQSAAQSRLFTAFGFDTSVQLAYLACTVDSRSGAQGATSSSIYEVPSDVQFVSYRTELRGTLEAVIEATYVGTLDAPQLNGKRDVKDIVDGYIATAHGELSRWWLVQFAGRYVGCLLLADHPASDQVELMYMGLVSEARGRGWGRRLVQQAQLESARSQRSRLVLAVDTANNPALHIYSAMGFLPLYEQSVRIKFLGK
jgi:ribosomal protein S18 acetylase RimI-like enzyme